MKTRLKESSRALPALPTGYGPLLAEIKARVKPLKYVSLLGAVLLLAVTVARAVTDDSMLTAPPEKKLFSSDKFLGLENGSLVESVYFWNVWKKLYPDEEAVVLITPPASAQSGKYLPVNAVTVYSMDGIVLAHSTDYGEVRLNTLKPEDLRGDSSRCLAEYLNSVSKLPLKPAAKVGTQEEQVQRAFNAFHDPEKMPFFPVAISDLPGVLGTSLVFDWNDSHYTWRPSMGAHREDPPKDPLTGQPLLCVKHSDLVESLIFVHDYQKAHPEEKAGLLFAPNNSGQGLDTIGLAAAAFTVKGVVHVRGYYFGDLVLDKKPHSFEPDDLAALFHMYKDLLLRTIGKYYEKNHSYDPVPGSYWDNLYNTLPSVFPQGLPGDNEEMQENRIFQRATEAGIPCDIALTKTRGRLVVLHWQTQRFSYASHFQQQWNPVTYYNENFLDTDLGVENGSLLESIHFRTVWIKLHPDEDAIILVTSGAGKDGRYPPVTAVTVYTNIGGKVWAHTTSYGTIPLPSLMPADLKKNAAHCLDVYLKTVAKLPRNPTPVFGMSDEQIQRAFDALHDPKTMPYFPVAIMDIPGSIKMPDGKTLKTDTKALVFDWNDAHYTWQPSTGALRENPPIEPLTGRPLLCVKHGDLVESLVFVYDYQKTHPEEKAVLLWAPNEIGPGESTIGLAAAAYTLNGVVHIRSYFDSDFVPKFKSKPFQPCDLEHPEVMAKLYQLYRNNLLSIFRTVYAKTHPNVQLQNKIHNELYSTLCSVFPQGLLGDTSEMQEDRVFQRAIDAGIPCVIALNKILGRLIVLHWQKQRFCYTGNFNNTGEAASYYSGIWDPNDMERLIDALLFAHDFNLKQPGDAVVVLPYRQIGLWDIAKGIAVYVHAGKVFAHNPEVGDILIPNANPTDLSNPAKCHTLRLAANNAIHSIDVANTAENTAILENKFNRELQSWIHDKGLQSDKWGVRKHVYEILMHPCNMSSVEVPSVYEKLKTAGIDCQLYATTTERKPDGRLAKDARPCIVFTFQNVSYTYGPEHYCSPANNLVLDP